VVVELVNKKADHFYAEIDIYYSPLVFDGEGRRLFGTLEGRNTVREAVKNYVQNMIPFNGEYRNADLIDVLQQLEGVVIPELKQSAFLSDDDFAADKFRKGIMARCTPVSGYFKVHKEGDLVLNFIAYSQNVE
jgi:hypothetical protein